MQMILLFFGFVLIVMFLFLWLLLNRLKKTRHELNAVIDTNHELVKQLLDLRQEESCKSKNRKEANEKLKALDNSVDSAIAGLSKH